MKFSSIRMSIRSLTSIRKVYRLVSAVSQVYQTVTQGSPKKILQSTKLVRVYCGSIPISLRDLRSTLEPLKSHTRKLHTSEIACAFSLKLHKWLSEIAWNGILRYIDVLIDITLITGEACAEVRHAAHAPCTYAI